MPEKYLHTGQYPVHYTVSGNGDPVVLLHGFGEDSRIWQDLRETLEQEYMLIIPDLPGSGRSVTDIAGVTMESLAETVKQVLDHENIKLCSMIGHSMGGYISMAFAARYGGMLSRLGLFSSSAFADSDEKKEGRKKNMAFITKHGTLKFLEQSVPKLFSPETNEKNPSSIRNMIDRYSNLLPASLVHYTKAMMNRPDRTEVLKDFPRPVLFILGEFDTAVPLEQGLRQSHLPGISYIYVCTHSGHMGMIEETEFCIDAVKYFLAAK